MRFGLTTYLMFSCLMAHSLMSIAAHAQNLQDTLVTRSPVLTDIAIQDARRVPQGAALKPQTATGLSMKAVGHNLGNIKAIVQDKDGTVFTIDEVSGRLYALSDRNQDGRFDGQSIISDRFIKPSGLTINGTRLFVSDVDAIWSVDIKTRKRTRLASLENSKAHLTPRPLLYKNNHIMIGLTKDDISQVLSVNMQTGQATLLKQFADAPLTALVQQKSGQLWAGIGASLRSITQEDIFFPVEAGATINGLAFSNHSPASKNGTQKFENALYISQGQTHSDASGGYNIIAVKGSFGKLDDQARLIASGFYQSRANSVWGKPQALLFTPHGLLVGDGFETLWRISPSDPKLTQINRKSKPSSANEALTSPTQKPSAARGETIPMQGSLIGAASQLRQGSHLKVGSTLIEKFDEEKASKEKENSAENNQDK